MAALTFRIDHRSPSHLTLTVFVNHANAGTLCVRVEEFDDLVRAIRRGLTLHVTGRTERNPE